MRNRKILIIEDDKSISQLIRYNLERGGFSCCSAITAEDGLKILDSQKIDLIILDIMLPEMDGLEACRLIKRDESLRYIPIIMLTAKGEEVDRIIGFELGADDYVVKPFSPRELTLRVKAVLQREGQAAEPGEILEEGKISVDIPRHKVTVDKKDVSLTTMEFKLLVTLMRRRGRVQSRQRLLEDVWDMASDVTTRTIDTHIKRLRQKLGKKGLLIETVRGSGYRFKEED